MHRRRDSGAHTRLHEVGSEQEEGKAGPKAIVSLFKMEWTLVC